MTFEPGDLLAFYGADRVSRIITLATASPFGPRRLRLGPSHVGIVCEHAKLGAILVESTTFSRLCCLVRGLSVSGCQAHFPQERIDECRRGGGTVDVYRLSPIDSLSLDESGLLTDILVKHFVRREVGYDLGGAIVSGTRVVKWLRGMPGADLDSLFCSELCAAVLMRLGRLCRANPTRFHPAMLLRRLVRQGTYRFVRSAGFAPEPTALEMRAA